MASSNDISVIKILLFDDDKDAASFISEIVATPFAKTPIEIIRVPSIREALEGISTATPDVVIASLSSKENEILSVIERIRDQYTDIPIITIGSEGYEDLALEAVQQGAQDCIFIETLDKTRVIPTIQYAIERRKISSRLMSLHAEQISATIQAVTDGVLITSEEKKVIFANKAAGQILWKPLGDIIGKMLPFEISPGLKVVHEIRSPLGEIAYIEVTTTIVPWEQGEAGFCVNLHDISDHTKVQKELKQASKVKDEFIAHMSHELRTPLNGVIGNTSLLLEHGLSDEKVDIVNTIRRSGEAMLDIVNDLLDLSKIEAGKIKVEEKVFDVANTIEQTLDIFTPVVKSKGILLASLIDSRVPSAVVSDDSKIRQIIANFVSNAVKFTDNGSITVEAVASGSKLELSVTDTGTGIAKDKQVQLFEPFAQLSEDREKNSFGTGLGLVISKKLAQLLGGSVSCHSSLHNGSRFTLEIPLKSVEEELGTELNALGARCIAVISNNPHLRSILKKLFEGINCRYLNPDKICLKGAADYDFVIVDGVTISRAESEFLAEIESLRESNQTPVLVLGDCPISPKQLDELRISTFNSPPLKTTKLLMHLKDLATKGVRDFTRSEKKRRELAQPSLDNFNLDGQRLLIAEDNLINKKVLIAMLEQLGIACDAVSNGQEAVAAARVYEYSAILMDCRMPVMDGFAAAEHIRDLSEHYSKIPIIAVTANANQREKSSSPSIYMNGVLPKPITIESLKDTLEGHLQWDSDIENHDNMEAITKTLDLNVIDSLKRISQHSRKNLLKEVLDIFRADSPLLIDSLRSEISKNNLSGELGEIAHKLKGSARNIGAESLAKACQKLENKWNISSKEALEHVDLIQECFDNTILALEQKGIIE